MKKNLESSIDNLSPKYTKKGEKTMINILFPTNKILPIVKKTNKRDLELIDYEPEDDSRNLGNLGESKSTKITKSGTLLFDKEKPVRIKNLPHIRDFDYNPSGAINSL